MGLLVALVAGFLGLIVAGPIGLAIGILLGILVAVSVKPNPNNAIKAGLRLGTLRPCPECKAAIPREASRCQHCAAPVEALEPLNKFVVWLRR